MNSDKDPKSLIYKEGLQFNKNNPIEKKSTIKHRPINMKIWSSSLVIFKLPGEATCSTTFPPIRLLFILPRISKEGENIHPQALLITAKIKRVTGQHV